MGAGMSDKAREVPRHCKYADCVRTVKWALIEGGTIQSLCGPHKQRLHLNTLRAARLIPIAFIPGN